MRPKPIEVSDDEREIVSATLIIIVMIILQALVIDRHLMNELGEVDTIRIALDLLLLCLMLTPVLRLLLLNLVLGKIPLFHHGIRRPFLTPMLT